MASPEGMHVYIEDKTKTEHALLLKCPTTYNYSSYLQYHYDIVIINQCTKIMEHIKEHSMYPWSIKEEDMNIKQHRKCFIQGLAVVQLLYC